MAATDTTSVPRHVYELPVGGRIRWARQNAGLSHDKLIAALGRSNRGHLIKIEKGIHVPGQELRDAIAAATGVPPELFAVPREVEPSGEPFRDGGEARGEPAARVPRRARSRRDDARRDSRSADQ